MMSGKSFSIFFRGTPNRAPLRKIFSIPVASESIPREISIREPMLPEILAAPKVGV